MNIRIIGALGVSFLSINGMEKNKKIRIPMHPLMHKKEVRKPLKKSAQQKELKDESKRMRQKRTFYRQVRISLPEAQVAVNECEVYQRMLRVAVPSLIDKHFGLNLLPYVYGTDYCFPLNREYIHAARACYHADNRFKGYCDEINVHQKELCNADAFVQPRTITKELQVPAQGFSTELSAQVAFMPVGSMY